MSKPIYCFTFDLDWASEPMIKYMINIFKKEDIPLTPFITHRSKVIEEEYKNKMFKVGVHPNFWSKSTHGLNMNEIINHVISLNPESKFFRSHGFYDTTNTSNYFIKKGFLFDSNLSLYPQNNIVPLKHSSGLIRFPVYLEDDYYLCSKPDFKAKTLKNTLLSSGLKIFNIHPIHIWLNSPSIKYYKTFKQRVNKPRYKNKGIETFTLNLIKYLKAQSNIKFYYLYDVYEMFKYG